MRSAIKLTQNCNSRNMVLLYDANVFFGEKEQT